ncbi:MAG: EamA family transporter [bacterium]|nr:EamA family transporter [bacterium]
MRSRFVALTLIWGASFLFIKIGVEALAPLQVAFGRMMFGALTVLAVALVRRERLPHEPRVWAHLLVAATLANTIPFTLFAYAERHITSALASIGNATVPLFTLLFALLLLPSERPTPRRSLGLTIGFVGVLVVLGAWRGVTAGPDTSGMLLILVAAACYGGSGVYMRRYLSSTSYSSLALSVGQLVAGALELALLLPFFTRWPQHLPVRVVAAVFALGAFGTGVAYVLSYGLIRMSGATVASMVTYFIPIVSITIGVVGMGEQLSWNAPLGAVIIVAGALLSRSQAAPVIPAARGEPAGRRPIPRRPPRRRA